MKTSLIIFIQKVSWNNLLNYRPITLNNKNLKLLDAILFDKIKPILE